MRQVHLIAIMIADQIDGILDHCHHSQAQQIDLDDSHIGAIIFVPLHDHTAGHGRRLERNHGIELSLADHHAARMLAQVTRQVLNSEIQLQKFSDALVREIQARVLELALGRVFRIFPFPGAYQA